MFPFARNAGGTQQRKRANQRSALGAERPHKLWSARGDARAAASHMGNCGSSGSAGDDVDPELARKNVEVKKAMAAAVAEDAKVIKMLLLGAGESGKSTIFKQMKIINKDGYSREERLAFRSIVWSNTIVSMKLLASSFDKIPGEVEDPNVKALLDRLEAATEEEEKLTLRVEEGGTVGKLIKQMWENDKIKFYFENRSKFQLNDSAEYYFNALDRISEESYEPNEQDVLRSRVRTTGIVQSDFAIKGVKFSMFDVGGQRNERRKWIHCFDNVHAVVFVAALSEFDQVLYEDESQNRMCEALDLFQQISNSKWFADTAMILFLNKNDLFEAKLAKLTARNETMAQYCTVEKGFREAYTGSNDYQQCVDYWKAQFTAQPQDKAKSVYTHPTCATDTSNVKFVFGAVVSIILEENMKASGLA